MKKIEIYIISAAIVVLFVLHFTGKSKMPNTSSNASNATIGKLPIAFVNIDSLIFNYELSKELNEVLLKKQEEARTNFGVKARALDNEMGEFQKKAENNGFLSRERAESEQKRLLQKRDELQQLEQSLNAEIGQKQQEISIQLHQAIVDYLIVYNKTKGYEVILSNTVGGTILYGKPAYNITKEVLDGLNKNYQKK